MQTVLIDTFTVPEESKAAFLAETRKIQAFLETLPGFVESFVYEKTAGENRINVVTTAVWENDAAMESAKKATTSQFQKQSATDHERTKNRSGKGSVPENSILVP